MTHVVGQYLSYNEGDQIDRNLACVENKNTHRCIIKSNFKNMFETNTQ